MADLLTPENLAKFEVAAQDINGEYVYLAWSIPGVVAFGNDMFPIRNGKIAFHTVGFHPAPISAWAERARRAGLLAYKEGDGLDGSVDLLAARVF